jgi:hypothetical protein
VQEQIRVRLAMLRHEMEKGQAELEKLASQQSQLRDTMLRIDGAAQVLEELLTPVSLSQDDGTSSDGGQLMSQHRNPSVDRVDKIDASIGQDEER